MLQIIKLRTGRFPIEQVEEISGGITNLLWKLVPHYGLDPVVIRVFGMQTDKLIDREQEQKALLQLNKAGFGAQVCASPASAIKQPLPQNSPNTQAQHLFFVGRPTICIGLRVVNWFPGLTVGGVW